MRKIEEPILRTLLYSDIFDYPLKDSEVWNFLIDKRRTKSEFSKTIREINSVVYRSGEYIFMEKRKNIVRKRVKRFKYSQEKLKCASRVIEKLAIFPSVCLIGISGSLSMMNSEKKDDIDLFVVVRKNTVWATRLILILYLKTLRAHRGRGDKTFSNKFCLNMIIDEQRLRFPKKSRNLYTAHEITQFIPIIQRDKTYERFINSNLWILKFLPNILGETKKRKVIEKEKSVIDNLFIFLRIPIFEKVSKLFQLFLIKKNKTRETISEGYLAFHPRDNASIILSKYEQRLLEYNLT